jgi:UDP-3-O-acyl N-acetylglucosamine deacetylase
MTAVRRTIANPVTLEGIGLHLGVSCRLTFRPAPSGGGIRFVRTDRPGNPVIPAVVEHAVLTDRRTQLGTGDDAIHTVEHVLAAVAGAEVDDLTIELDGPEPPIMDGSAGAFLEALSMAGATAQTGKPQYLTLRSPVRVVDGESVYEAHPCHALDLSVTIDFAHPLIGRQECRYTVTPDVFAREIAPARTFGFVREVDALRSMGLIRGGSTQNAIVLDADGVVENTPQGARLRW